MKRDFDATIRQVFAVDNTVEMDMDLLYDEIRPDAAAYQNAVDNLNALREFAPITLPRDTNERKTVLTMVLNPGAANTLRRYIRREVNGSSINL